MQHTGYIPSSGYILTPFGFKCKQFFTFQIYFINNISGSYYLLYTSFIERI